MSTVIMGTETMKVPRRVTGISNLSREIHAVHTYVFTGLLNAGRRMHILSRRKPDIPESPARAVGTLRALSLENFLLPCGFCATSQQKCTHAHRGLRTSAKRHARTTRAATPIPSLHRTETARKNRHRRRNLCGFLLTRILNEILTAFCEILKLLHLLRGEIEILKGNRIVVYLF